MDWTFFPKKSLGIDIGVSSIKVVEVSSGGKKNKLENYVEFRFPKGRDTFRAFDQENLLLETDKTAEVLTGLLDKMGIKQKKAAFSIPDFSTFFTTFNLPPMSEGELAEAVRFEARHHIPIPLSDVSFDWKVVEKKQEYTGSKLQILLVAVPNRVLESYQRLGMLCELEVKGLEAEAFGLVRTAIPPQLYGRPVGLIDFGWQSTTVSVAENGGIKMSYSYDISGTSLTEALSRQLSISQEEAEQLKRQYGLNPARREVYKVLIDRISDLALEVEKICRNFYQTEEREVEAIILSGGTAWLAGLKEYFANQLEKKVEITNPFWYFEHPVALTAHLRKLGPSFAVALGVGLMGAQT